MICWKCGNRMSKSSGTAICYNCGRTVSYKTKSGYSSSYSGGGNGCLIDGLFGCITYLLYGVLILIGVGVIGVVLLLTKIFG